MAGKLSKQLTGITGLLTVLIFILSSARCDNEKPFASQILTFMLPTTIEPSDSIISIGDTLWIIADISDSLFEYHTKTKYKLLNFDFGQTSIGIRKLQNKNLGLGDQLSAASKFNTIVKSGEIVFPGETFIDFKYEYNTNNQRYLLKIGLNPKETGVFCIALLSPQFLNYEGIIDLGENSDGARIIPVYEDIFFPINEGVNNFELFKKHCLDNTIGQPENYREVNYIQKGTFTFRVVE